MITGGIKISGLFFWLLAGVGVCLTIKHGPGAGIVVLIVMAILAVLRS